MNVLEILLLNLGNILQEETGNVKGNSVPKDALPKKGLPEVLLLFCQLIILLVVCFYWHTLYNQCINYFLLITQDNVIKIYKLIEGYF